MFEEEATVGMSSLGTLLREMHFREILLLVNPRDDNILDRFSRYAGVPIR